MIAEIRAENDRIPDSSLSDKLEKLENLCAEVFRAVYDKPAKAPQISKFMDYYLPTTLKMVRGLRTLDERGVTGAQAQDARRRIADALDVVIQGCQRLLENLYRDDVLDLTTDIDVLEQMLKRDGLTESDLERAAAQAREAARIDAEATGWPARAPRAGIRPPGTRLARHLTDRFARQEVTHMTQTAIPGPRPHARTRPGRRAGSPQPAQRRSRRRPKPRGDGQRHAQRGRPPGD